MDLSDWISIISIIVAIGALVYSILSNTKKYELTYHPITKTMNGKALKRRRKKRVRIFSYRIPYQSVNRKLSDKKSDVQPG